MISKALLVVVAVLGLLAAPGPLAPCGFVGEDIPRPWYIVDPFTGAELPCPDDVPPPTPTPGPVLPVLWLPVVLKSEAPPPPEWRLYLPLITNGPP